MRLLQFVFLSISTFFLCRQGLAQEHIWRMGIHAGTGYYQLYNKNDWNADPVLIYPVKSQTTNWTIGVTTTYTWGKHWGLSSGLLLSKNRQEFQAARNPSSPNPPGTETYNLTNEFNYLKLPVNFQFSTNNQARHQFRALLGLQTSFLLNYRERFLQTSVGFRSESETHNKVNTDLSPNPAGQVFFDRFLYNRFLLGSVAEFSYNLQTSNNWLLSIGMRGEYDLTNAENHKARVEETGQLIWVSSLKRAIDNNIDARPKTLNRSVGLFLSASIPIDIR